MIVKEKDTLYFESIVLQQKEKPFTYSAVTVYKK
jgi:hypothetical protein